MGCVEGVNNLVNYNLNESVMKIMNPKVFTNYRKLVDMGHVSTIYALEHCYQDDIDITRAANKVKMYYLNIDHFIRTDNPKPCIKKEIRARKNELNEIEVKKI